MLLNPSGQPINENDYQMLLEMLTGSLEQHIANLNISAHNPEFLHPEFFTPALNVYEEGLVVRGREELDAGHFDAENDPVLGLMFNAIALFSQGETVIENSGNIEIVFPDVIHKLKEIAKS